MKTPVTTLGWTVIAFFAISSLKPLKGEAEVRSTHNLILAETNFSTSAELITTVAELKKQLDQKEKELRALEKLLFTANADAESSQRELEARQKQEAALGLEALTADEKELQQRLVTALSSLYRSEQERKKAFEALTKLVFEIESSLQGIKLPAEVRKKLQAHLEQAQAVMLDRDKEKQSVLNAGLLQAEVLGFEPKFNLVILNVGWIHEVKAGMVFEIGTATEIKALCRVVDVRKRLSGALIEKVLKDDLVVGDPARVKLIKVPKLEN